jgi:hypothetical protein
MDTQINKVYIQENGQRIEAQGEKLAYILSWQAEIQEQERLIKEEQIKKAELKAAILNRLGLTSEEAQLIIGGSN